VAPRHNSLSVSDPDPRNNEGVCYGLAADANGNLWVASAADPVIWDQTSGITPYKVDATAYVRSLRFYRRLPDDSYILSVEVPVTHKLTGIALGSDGTLYASEGKTTEALTNSTSRSIHVYRGVARVGTVDTGADGLWNLQPLAAAPDNAIVALGQTGTSGTSSRAIRQWSVGDLPSVTTHAVSGAVTDATTGKAISGATVRVYDQDATTDANGHYAVSVPATDAGTGPAEAMYTVTADAANYRRTRKTPVSVTSDVVVNLSMAPANATPSNMAYFVEATVGGSETWSGLTRAEAPNGDSTVVSVDGGVNNARRTGAGQILAQSVNANKNADRYLTYDVDDAFLPAGSGPNPVFITAHWQSDEGNLDPSPWRVEYDSVSNASASSASSNRTAWGVEQWTSFYLSDARMQNRKLSGSDFSLYEQTSGAFLTVRDVAVTQGLPRITAIPPGYEAGIAPGASLFAGAPTAFNGIVYAGTTSGELNAYDAASGAAAPSFGTGGSVSLGAPIVGRPVVFLMPDGAPRLCVCTNNGRVMVLDAVTGAQEWVYDPGNDASQRWECTWSPAVYVDTSTGVPIEMVYVGMTRVDGTTSERVGHLLRIRGDDPVGSLLDMPLGTEITSAVAISAGSNNVMVGYTDGADGHLLILKNPRLGTTWVPVVDVTAPGEAIKVPPMLSGDGQAMILGSSDGTAGHLYAVNPSNGTYKTSVAMAGVETPPWVDYPAHANAASADTVYLGTSDGFIHCLNLTDLTERAGWPVRPVPGHVGGSLFTLNNKLYVGSDLGMLVMDPANPTSLALFSPAYQADGNTPPTRVAPGFNSGSSAGGRVSGASSIFMLGSDRKLYAMYVQ
jgi:outer membrane protein assembly factor BamB